MSSNVVVPNQGYHVFAYEMLEANQRIKQIKYYCYTKSIPRDKIMTIDYHSFDCLKNSLNQLRPNHLGIQIQSFHLLCHGEDGFIQFPEGIIISTHDFMYKHCRNFFYIGAVKIIDSVHWIICDAVMIDVFPGDALWDRTYVTETNNRGSIVYVDTIDTDTSTGNMMSSTFNIPLKNDEWAHTGLNPELLNDPKIYKGCLDDLKRKYPEKNRIFVLST